MASHGHDALWAKLWELELQLAAYKLMHAARCGEDDDNDGAGAPETACCRGRQYDAYMRRRDARRASVAAAEVQRRQRPGAGTRGRPTPLTVKCAARDTPQVRRSLPAVPTTPRKEHGALPLARSKTVSGGSGAPAARPQSHHRRNSVGGDLGDCGTPRPFLRRGSGTGGATAVHLRSPRVHDLPGSSPSPRRPRPQDQLATKPRHLRSVSEVPFHASAATESPSPRWAETPGPAHARVRKQWGSAENPPPVLFSAAATNPHMDLAKGLKKLLSFVRKSKSSSERQQHGGGGRDSGDGKPVKEWARAAACSGLDDGPFDRARLEGHRFPMTRPVGTSR
ncbi:uncharacterized protein [Lolium perenne]|uniref:uncharacterized protein n=1 Tax=Lolium perenne TaxID=4522 RepID=UPI0021EB1D48|nr:uncharacterized protein LOC127298137 [Lolium perenne]